MTDGWDAFIREYEDDNLISSYKPKVIVTIYGSYHPKRDKKLLIELKTILKKDGYSNTRLVKDIQKKGDDPLDKSQWCLLNSDINLLVFTKKGKRLGVVDELATLTENPKMEDKIPFSIVLYHVPMGQRPALPDLSKSRIYRYNVPMRDFSSFKELKSFIRLQTYWILSRWVRENRR